MPLLNKTRFRHGKFVDSLRPVRAVELLVAASALLGGVLALAAFAALRAARPRARRVEEAALALSTALGDAVLLLDGAGRILVANEAAGRLAGVAPHALEGEGIAALGEDLRVLARGLARGAASGTVSLGLRAGPTARARAALARVSTRPPRDLVVLRPEAAAPQRPPPLPATCAPPAPSPADPAEARAGLAAAAAAVRDPLARAARATSLLRLCSPPLQARPAAALAALEEALEEAERRVAALAAAGQPGLRRVLDLSALVDDVVRSASPPRGVRVRADVAPARALGDDRPLRAALREVVRCAAASLSAGEEVVVAVRGGGPAPSVVVAAPGARAGALAPLARALLAPHGARVEELPAPAHAWRLRVVLPAAPADALAPA
jgi:hypothetical protein